MRRRRKAAIRRYLLLGILACVLVAVLAGAVSVFHATHQTEDYAGTVTDKVVKNYGSGSSSDSKYLIFVKLDNGQERVFEDTDSVLFGKFNSSDLYGQLQVGHHYTFHTFGVRVPLMSWYEDIISVGEGK